MLRTGVRDVTYAGLDLSSRYLEISRAHYPGVAFYDTDVLDPSAPPLPVFDCVVLNGIFTFKGRLSPDEMIQVLEALVPRVCKIASVGIAFNVSSKQVDWEREDLFHLSVDQLLDFLARRVSRHVVIRHDYGLYEYTAYVYHQPSDPDQASAKPLLESAASRTALDVCGEGGS